MITDGSNRKGNAIKCRNLYVRDVRHSVTSDELQELFTDYGDVEKVNIIEGKSFGFFEMSKRSEADRARQALNGADFQEPTFRINEARLRKS